MATVFVDLVNLDGSRPEGRLKFSLEQLRIGDPDVVPSSVEVAILDGKALVEDLLPGEMKVQVSTGRWSKEWQVAIPDNGTHDLFDLLGTSAPEFEHALYATLLGRVEKLEQVPPVDLAPVEQRLDALEGAPVVDLAPLENRVTALQAKLADMPNFTPVNLMDNHEDEFQDALSPLWAVSGNITASLWMGRVNIAIQAPIADYSIPVFEDGLKLVGFPTPTDRQDVTGTVWLASDTAYRPAPGGIIEPGYRDGFLTIRQSSNPEDGGLRKALEDGYTQLRIEIEYFTTDTV